MPKYLGAGQVRHFLPFSSYSSPTVLILEDPEAAHRQVGSEEWKQQLGKEMGLTKPLLSLLAPCQGEKFNFKWNLAFRLLRLND